MAIFLSSGGGFFGGAALMHVQENPMIKRMIVDERTNIVASFESLSVR